MAMATSASPVAMVPVHAVCRTVSPRLPMGNCPSLGHYRPWRESFQARVASVGSRLGVGSSTGPMSFLHDCSKPPNFAANVFCKIAGGTISVQYFVVLSL